MPEKPHCPGPWEEAEQEALEHAVCVYVGRGGVESSSIGSLTILLPSPLRPAALEGGASTQYSPRVPLLSEGPSIHQVAQVRNLSITLHSDLSGSIHNLMLSKWGRRVGHSHLLLRDCHSPLLVSQVLPLSLYNLVSTLRVMVNKTLYQVISSSA